MSNESPRTRHRERAFLDSASLIGTLAIYHYAKLSLAYEISIGLCVLMIIDGLVNLRKTMYYGIFIIVPILVK